ncbi:hypothetical protein ACL9RL_09400 [Plantibacter sp. Mn2098]|uniref:hypothetical protein n=1 Tax=Plantibacter sp. Mn2098 TaxID=3395266 RepID=UPI003BC8B913
MTNPHEHYPLVLQFQGAGPRQITADEGFLMVKHAEIFGVSVFDLTDADVMSILSAGVIPDDASSLADVQVPDGCPPEQRESGSTVPYLPPGYLYGLDGKVYPTRPRKPNEMAAVAGLSHRLSHEGLSTRQIVAALEERHGIRRSVGSVNGDLTKWRCGDCSGEPDNPPEQPGGDAA